MAHVTGHSLNKTLLLYPNASAQSAKPHYRNTSLACTIIIIIINIKLALSQKQEIIHECATSSLSQGFGAVFVIPWTSGHFALLFSCTTPLLILQMKIPSYSHNVQQSVLEELLQFQDPNLLKLSSKTDC